MGFIHKLEFQKRGFADEVLGALRILNPGKLDEQAVFSLKANVRLADPELVDPVSNGFKGLFHGHFLDPCSFLVRKIQGNGQRVAIDISGLDSELFERIIEKFIEFIDLILSFDPNRNFRALNLVQTRCPDLFFS